VSAFIGGFIINIRSVTSPARRWTRFSIRTRADANAQTPFAICTHILASVGMVVTCEGKSVLWANRARGREPTLLYRDHGIDGQIIAENLRTFGRRRVENGLFSKVDRTTHSGHFFTTRYDVASLIFLLDARVRVREFDRAFLGVRVGGILRNHQLRENQSDSIKHCENGVYMCSHFPSGNNCSTWCYSAPIRIYIYTHAYTYVCARVTTANHWGLSWMCGRYSRRTRVCKTIIICTRVKRRRWRISGTGCTTTIFYSRTVKCGSAIGRTRFWSKRPRNFRSFVTRNRGRL